MPFEFEGCAVRVVLRDGEPWFVLVDVCRVLSIGNPSQAAARLDGDERYTLINNEGIADARARALTIISESGLYALILTSRKPAARRFRKWVTADVLPALRRTGRYEVPPSAAPDSAPEDNLPVPVTCGHALAPADDPDLTAGEMNAWTGCVRLVRGLYGRRAARGVYERSPLPAVPDEASDRDDNARRCIERLLTSPTGQWAGGSQMTVRDLVHLAAFGDLGEAAPARQDLRRIGVDVVVIEGAKSLVVSTRHEGVARIYAETQWRASAEGAGLWSQALGRLRGAKKGHTHRFTGVGPTKTVVIPLAALDIGRLPHPDEAGVIDIPDLDGAACLAHLCSARVARTGLVLGDLIRVARDDPRTRAQLAQIGILVRPDNWRGWVAIARAHPRLQRVYACTPWAADWSTPLMLLPGARPSEGYVGGFDRQRVAVMVPMDVVDRVVRERVPAVAG
ncbi:Bro-N domain-containing protein [Tistrella bauzanensis]|uniref:BRO-N domain-containing protein n=1 Tax=Tistrella TaxID=171436 RepID=UPI0031F717A8